MASNGVINIRGKEYKTVALRVTEFRAAHPEYAIRTKIIRMDDHAVVVRAVIKSDSGRTLATGYAEEYRESSQINRTSALENCETSAIGRALASLGFAGSEYASADELVNAVTQQAAQDAMQPVLRMMAAVRDNWESVNAVKDALAVDDYDRAAEAMAELSDEVKQALWVAPTKGGVFTTEERAKMKSDEFAAARSAMYSEEHE